VLGWPGCFAVGVHPLNESFLVAEESQLEAFGGEGLLLVDVDDAMNFFTGLVMSLVVGELDVDLAPFEDALVL